MMLQALIQYAERENLGDPDFEQADVRWLIPLSGDGTLAGSPIPLYADPSAKKPRPKRMWKPFTSPNELSVGGKSHFLCDTLERTLLYLDAKDEDKRASRAQQHEYYAGLLREAAAAVPEAAADLNAVLTFLVNDKAVAALIGNLRENKAKPSDNAIFSIDGRLLVSDERIKEFWRARRRAMRNSKGAKQPRICIATGELTETMDTTEKIKGVPGGLAMGTNLISFDKDAFCSYGLEQAQNAALSEKAELMTRSALNKLIEISKAQRLVFNDTVHLHWTRKKVETDEINVLTEADPEAVAALLHSVHDGRQYLGLDENAYYAMSLSGNGARIVVRDWLESTVPEVRRNIAHWFEDLAIVSQEDGRTILHDFKFNALLYAMVRDKPDELPPNLSSQLWNAALKGRTWPVPETCLCSCLNRQRIETDNRLNPRRMALIKLCLLRLNNPSTTKVIMTEKLDSDCADLAYLCGRLFAVFDRLQFLALGGVNAGVVERFYASASTTPALVMGRLFRNAQNHLSKASGGIATNVSKDFEEITKKLGCTFPTTLSLEEQGRFALGYYHQKADYRRISIERKEAKAEESSAVQNV
jgi:CRISPR-associated protein Csd1